MAVYLVLTSTKRGVLLLLVCGFMSGSTRRHNRQWFWFKTSQKMGPQLKVSSEILGELGIKLGIPGYKVSGLSTTPWQLISPFVSNFGIQ